MYFLKFGLLSLMTSGFLLSFGLNCRFRTNPFLSGQTLSSVNFAFFVQILVVQLQFFLYFYKTVAAYGRFYSVLFCIRQNAKLIFYLNFEKKK